jgi:hypothetical protein
MVVMHPVTLTIRTAEEAATSEIGPGILAFTVVVLLGIATFLLLRSMMHHIRKVPPTFETDDRSDAQTSGRPDDPSSGPGVS